MIENAKNPLIVQTLAEREKKKKINRMPRCNLFLSIFVGYVRPCVFQIELVMCVVQSQFRKILENCLQTLNSLSNEHRALSSIPVEYLCQTILKLLLVTFLHGTLYFSMFCRFSPFIFRVFFFFFFKN